MKSKLFTWYFSKRALPYWGVLAVDCAIVFVSLLVAHAINCSLLDTVENLAGISLALCVYLVCFILSFRIFRTYSGIIRYSSFQDLLKVGFSVALGSAMVQTLRMLAHMDKYLAAISAQDLALGSVLAILLMWIVRIGIKAVYDSYSSASRYDNIVIVGTRSGGLGIAYSILSQRNSPYRICGFVTHIPELASHTLLDKPVIMYNDPDLLKFFEKNKVSAVFISPIIQEAFVNHCQNLITEFISRGIRIMMTPASFEWDGKSDMSHLNLKEVSVEDLLPRKKIEVDLEKIGEMLAGRRILITGAAGSIGSEIVRQVAKFGPEELILIDQAETPMHDLRLMMAGKFPQVKASTIVASITNQSYMEDLFREHKPEYVFHAAAYKHVPMMEDNPAIAVQNNVRGTRIIADLAVKYGTGKFVMISTDKAVNPTSVMGCSKRICEIYCQSLNAEIAKGNIKQADGTAAVTQFVTTRFGNVLGSNGSVIPIFREQIKNGGPVTVTHPDIVRYFMLISEACKLVLEAGTMGKGGEIFVFEMGQPVKIADLARRMIDMSGAKNIQIVYTGLRDGEKLYEEVLGDGENDKPTCHPQIKVSAVREYPYEEALRLEEELLEISKTGSDADIIGKMKEIVPEYAYCK